MAVCGRAVTTPRERRGAAAVELAVLLPLLVFLFLIVLDFGRVYYGALIANTCARNGAIHAGYMSNATALKESPYASTGQAAAADGTNIALDPTTDVRIRRDDADKTVTVTATHRFELFTDELTIPNGGNVPRTIVMPQIPVVPQ